MTAAAEAYGKSTGFFLACGPMSTDYCPEVEWVISHATTAGAGETPFCAMLYSSD